MKQILLKLDGNGRIPPELLREIMEGHEELELVFDAEEYDQLFPIMKKLFDEVSLARIQMAKQRQEKINQKEQDKKKLVRAPMPRKARTSRLTGQERRALVRFDINRQARIKLWEDREFDSCFIHDMNLKGMRISLHSPLMSQAVVKGMIVLSNNMDLDIEARVAWEKMEEGQYMHGISFSRIKDADKDRLYEYINNHNAQMKDKWWAKG